MCGYVTYTVTRTKGCWYTQLIGRTVISSHHLLTVQTSNRVVIVVTFAVTVQSRV